MKKHCRGFCTAVLMAGLFSAAFAPAALAQNPRSMDRLNKVREKAWRDGRAQVIVHFAVPDIEALSADSAKFGVADATAAIAGARTLADTALARAIEAHSFRVLTDLQGTSFDVVDRFDYFPLLVLQASPQALAVLESSPNVLDIEEDVPLKLIDPVVRPGGEGKAGATAGGDPLEPMLDDSAGIVGADAAWSKGYTGAGWYVAVLDTGIRRTHQFFTGKTIIEACRAKGQDGRTPAGDCPNGKWKMDGPGSAAHLPVSYDGYDHGTHVAGIAAGNYGSLAGVAKDANIIAVNVFSMFPGDVLAWSSDIIAGLSYVYSLRGSYNIASVNLSLGGGRYYAACDKGAGAAYKKPIDLLRAAGIATVIATGNEEYCDSVGSPSCVSTAVAVGSTTKADARSWFSNFHATMQKLFAPGSWIYSATDASDSSYEEWCGTSMATPHVAGAWALLRQAYPAESVTNLLAVLRATGIPINACSTTGNPRLQIDAALDYPRYDLTTVVSPAGAATVTPSGTTSYFGGSAVSVQLKSKKGYVMTGWSGDLTGVANPAAVVMNADKSLTANFIASKFLNAPVLLGPANGAAVAGTEATLQWRDTNGSPQEKKYKVRIKIAGKKYKNYLVPAGTVSKIVTGLIPGATYSWNVQAVGPAGSAKTSPWANNGVDYTFTVAE